MRLTDADNADRLITRYGDELRYCAEDKAWYRWDGRRWAEDSAESIYQVAIEVARSWEDDAADATGRQRALLLRHAEVSQNYPKLSHMLALARTNPAITVRSADWDRNPNLLNVANGTIDLNTGEFMPFDPTHLITKLAPVAYRRDAVSGVWLKFLTTVIPDAAVRDFLQRAIGYSVTGHMGEECMFMLYGGGRNGKTTFTTAILNMLGDYGAQAASSALMRSKGNGPSNELYVLRGSRFVLASETGELGQLDEELVKQATGGERISVNPKYRNQQEFRPQWKIWLGTNHEPIIRGGDDAIWSRIHKVVFPVTIKRPDADLKRRLTSSLDERGGILNWVLQGVAMWRSEGLSAPEAITTATGDYRAAYDLIGQFLSDCCQRHPDLTAYKGELYQAYSAYCRTYNERPKSVNGFGHDLKQRGVRESRDRNGRYWIGVGADTRVNLLPGQFPEVG